MKEQYNHQGDTEMIAICMFIIFFLYLLWLLTMSFSLWPIFAILGAILFVGISVELHFGTPFRVAMIASLSLSLIYSAAQLKIKSKEGTFAKENPAKCIEQPRYL